VSNEATVRPSNKMYGVTHDLQGKPRVIEPKTVKVGFGLPKGPAIYVYIDRKTKAWVVVVGLSGKDAKAERRGFSSKEEAKKFYRGAKEKAPARNYPGKVGFFLFNHVSQDGSFEPDWDVIEAHGPAPTEIDIVCLEDDPFKAAFQLWTATEMKCTGDGMNGMRVLSMATDKQKQLADQAQRNGERMFPIVNGCWTRGCPHSEPQGNEKSSACKPHGRFLFQLLNSPRLGSTAYFDTTSYRSINQIFSCLEKFRTYTGRGNAENGHVAGIPLKMVLRPYRTVHDEKPTTQFGVYLEFRADSVVAAKRLLMGHSDVFQSAGPARLTEAVDLPPAAAIAAEFTAEAEAPEAPGNGHEPPPEIEEDYSEVTGELGSAWDETPSAPEPAGAPVAPAASDDKAALSARGTGPKWRVYYELCHSRGMSDVQILQELGTAGYEGPEGMPEKAYPELMRRAEAFKPAQGVLL
jgi:hypothetical protein